MKGRIAPASPYTLHPSCHGNSVKETSPPPSKLTHWESPLGKQKPQRFSSILAREGLLRPGPPDRGAPLRSRSRTYRGSKKEASPRHRPRETEGNRRRGKGRESPEKPHHMNLRIPLVWGRWNACSISKDDMQDLVGDLSKRLRRHVVGPDYVIAELALGPPVLVISHHAPSARAKDDKYQDSFDGLLSDLEALPPPSPTSNTSAATWKRGWSRTHPTLDSGQAEVKVPEPPALCQDWIGKTNPGFWGGGILAREGARALWGRGGGKITGTEKRIGV